MPSMGVSGSAICLRCRLRLLRRYVQFQPLEPSNRIFRTQYTNLRLFTTETPAQSPDHGSALQQENKTLDSQRHDRNGEPRDSDRPLVKRINAHKRRLSRNRILTEDTKSLGSDMLGKPASVIVMRDGGMYKKKDRLMASSTADSAKPDSLPVNIEALLESQRETPSAEEVRENIDSLKPKTETALSNKQFRELQSLLQNGFLSAQLNDYLHHHMKDDAPLPTKESQREDAPQDINVDKASKNAWIKHISRWVPLSGKSSVIEGSDPNLYGYVAESAPAKEKLVVRVMRECWGLSIAELDAGLGEINVKIRAHEFLLLLRATRRGETALGKMWLDPGEKIEAFRNQNTLRLTTTKTKASTLIQGLRKTLQEVATVPISMDLIPAKDLDEPVLEEVGRITNTHVRKNDRVNRLFVTWLKLNERSSKTLMPLEDRHDLVFRLLVTALSRQPKTTTTLSIAGVDEDSSSRGRFIVDSRTKDILGWKDRMGRWGRYTLPLPSGDGNYSVESRLERLELPVEPPKRPQSLDGTEGYRADTESPTPAKWAEALRASTKAHFGRLLHEANPSLTPLSPPELLTRNYPRVFAPTTPHPLHLAQLEAENGNPSHSTINRKTMIVVRFWPAPIDQREEKGQRGKKRQREKKGQCRQILPSAPPLELHLIVCGGKVQGVDSLRAIKQTYIRDVMQPASPVDLRFSQTQFAALEGEPAGLAAWPPLANFLRAAHFDLNKDRIEMPSHQTFPVPQHLFEEPLPACGSDELVDTKYMLAGLEVRRSVSSPYGEYELTYTSVDGRQGGGRWTEVSLGLRSDSDDASAVTADKDKLQDSFLATCKQFAQDDALWSGYVSTT
ncbi:mitochondrial inner-membrane-bound regulator-domain-containing protein [Hypomontagnella monticulosa]|nr:mitochondrial inner-membrane-bound regulator-domain-containing protein [Hypomontagnella monticulosa]